MVAIGDAACMLLGLRTIVYPAPDLAAAKAWFTQLVGAPPYFDEPFYVGFSVGGHELGLDPDADPAAGPVTYWGVADVDAAIAALVAQGADEHDPIRDVGEGIRLASVRGPGGVIVGVIENPPSQ
jgi:predicted enzyme related to lactoylglutathione lyase